MEPDLSKAYLPVGTVVAVVASLFAGFHYLDTHYVQAEDLSGYQQQVNCQLAQVRWELTQLGRDVRRSRLQSAILAFEQEEYDITALIQKGEALERDRIRLNSVREQLQARRAELRTLDADEDWERGQSKPDCRR